MSRFIAQRFAESLLVLVIMSFVIYGLIGLMPGDPIDVMVSSDPDLTPADGARLRALYGLDQPIVVRYWRWLTAALSGDLGFSRLHARPVLEILLPRLGNTLLLMGLSFALALAIALPAGIVAAVRPRSALDNLINMIAFAGISVPPFWLAILLIMLFAVSLGWLPAGGMGEAGGGLASRIEHLILPLLALTLATVGGILRFVRAAMMEALRQDYIRTARAKGVSRTRVVLGHALRNAMIPVATILQPGPGGPAVRDGDHPLGQPGGRHGLCLARSTDFLPMSGTPTDRLAAEAAIALGPSLSVKAILWRRFLEHRLAVGSLVVLLVLALAALATPVIEALLGLDANLVDLFGRFQPPSAEHLLGTDELGRDLLLRLLYGGRVSLLVGLTTALFAALIGTALGLLAGYYRGSLDAVLMRLADGVIALPLLPLLIVLAAVDLGKLGLPEAVAGSENVSLYRIVGLIVLVGWTTVARLVRGATLTMRTREFVRAAEGLGAGGARIMLVHILPNVVSPIIVATTLSVGNIILLESVLSFLGLGIQPPIPSWGNMLTNAQELIWSAPHLAIYPGLLIFVTVIAFNFLGDGLQDALDPRAIHQKK
jgi:peptide/nickel transport system permease protein